MSTNLNIRMVHVIGVYFGHSKPTPNELLFPFVTELDALMKDGFSVYDKFIDSTVVVTKKIRMKYVVCDLPALALVKNIKNPTGYASCSKCTVMGVYREKRMTFIPTEHNLMADEYQTRNLKHHNRPRAQVVQRVDTTVDDDNLPEASGDDLPTELHKPTKHVEARTDASFRNKTDENHHHDTSPFEAATLIDMIELFTIDPMHTVFLGTVRRLLKFIRAKGQKKDDRLITEKAFLEIGILFAKFKFPFEFSRNARDFSHLDKWKATELRNFLLYGIDVIIRISTLPRDLVHVIQMFSMAIRMLADSELYVTYNELAANLINSFLDTVASFLGDHFVTLMMHCLTHLPNECMQNGPLDLFSCFKYENCLKSLKMCCKSFRFPLESLSNHLQYKSNFESNSRRPIPKAQIDGAPKGPKCDDEITRQYVPSGIQYRYVRCNNFKLSDSAPNCYFYSTKDTRHIYEIHGIARLKLTGKIKLVCYRWKTESAYSIPTSDINTQFSSSAIGVMRMRVRELHPTLVAIESVHRKCVVNCVNGQTFSWPLL